MHQRRVLQAASCTSTALPIESPSYHQMICCPLNWYDTIAAATVATTEAEWCWTELLSTCQWHLAFQLERLQTGSASTLACRSSQVSKARRDGVGGGGGALLKQSGPVFRSCTDG